MKQESSQPRAGARLQSARRFGLMVLVASTLLLGGCLSSVPGLKSGPPEWVNQPPPDTGRAWYGIGEGHDLNTARRLALRDIAAKFKVSVEGQTTSQISERNGRVDRGGSVKVSDRVEAVEFKNPVVEKTAPSPNGGVYALVRIDRLAFFQDLREKFNGAADQVSAATADLGSKTQVEQLLVLRRQDKTIDQAMGYYPLLQQGGLTEEDRSKAAQLTGVRSKSELITQQLVFVVRTAREHQDVADVVTKFLTDNNVKTRSDGGSASATVEATVKPRLDSVQGSKLVRLDVSLQVKDDRQQTVSGQNYVASGASLTSHDNARQQALNKLQDDLRKAGLINGLGFKVQ
ncbi:MAG: LPP20 family lipoprotein [Burkholderiales bacterium]|nr:LPP20 family lipoprotein [Burkholderiales bacterium]